MSALAALLLGYVLGSVPTGLIVGRVYRRVDIRDYGSGKTGVTNTLRMFGLGAAALVFVADVAKGAVPVLVGRFVFDDPWAAAAGGLAAVAGHSWPLFARFRGGRGASTTFGAFLALVPLAALVMLVFGAGVLLITRYVSLMSVTGVFGGFLLLIALVVAGLSHPEYLLFGVFVTASVELHHIGNIRRLIAGTEPKIGRGGSPTPPGQA